MLDHEEERSLILLPEGEEPCRTGNQQKDQVLKVRWQKGVFFRPVLELSAEGRNSEKILLHMHTGAERCA